MNILTRIINLFRRRPEIAARDPLSKVSNEVAEQIIAKRMAYITAERKTLTRAIRQAIKNKKARKALYARQDALTQEQLRLEALRNG